MNQINNLDDMTSAIIDTVESEYYVPMDMRELTSFLGISAGQYDMFAQATDILVRGGNICVTKRGKLIKASASGFLTGEFRGTSKGFGFVTQENGDIFVSHSNSNGAMNGDRVQVRLIPGSHGDHREGEIVRVLERAISEFVGTVKVVREGAPSKNIANKKGKKHKPVPKKVTTRFVVIPDDPKLCFKAEVLPAQANGAKDGDKVLVKLTGYPDSGSKIARGRVLRIFGETDSREANYNAILHENGIKLHFDEDTLIEARSIASGCEISERLDLRDKVIFTIDGADAKDFDDAVSIERDGDGYLLGVHIADVTHYVTPGSALDREAMKRGTSVYFTDKVVPMLPEELSNGVCSLNRDSDKYALSALIRLSSDGTVLSSEFRETVIASKVRGVYHEVNDVLANGESSEFFGKYSFLMEETLPLMIELYEKLLEKSRKRGSLELETTESVIILGDDGMPFDIVPRERGVSERMIEQFMLAANEAAANWLTSMELPCVFRIHEEPSSEKVQAFAEFIHNIGFDVRPLNRRKILPSSYRDVAVEASQKGLSAVVTPIMLRSLMKAKYSSARAPHFGLGCDLYCHFTSPIRRYPDLAVHRIIKAALHGEIDGESLPKYEAFAHKAAEQSSECELRALGAERDIEDLYKALYMADKIGYEYEAVISSVTGFGMFAELENTCEGLIPINTLEGWFEFDDKSRRLIGERGEVYMLGQRIRIRVELCDVVARKLEFSLVEKC